MSLRRPTQWLTASAALLLVVIPFAADAADLAAGIPPDGAAGPVLALSAVKTSAAVGSMVTTNVVLVTSVSCPDCASATTAADFTIGEGTDSMRVHVQNTWQARYNVKKQNNVPAAGQHVVVQGRIESSGGVRYIEMKRFGERDHTGPTVKAYDVAAGKYATGTFVWLATVNVLNVAKWDDGDRSMDVRDPAGGGLVHVEMAPPFYGQIRMPNKDELVRPYGMVRFDPDHNWWEIHPIRCLNPGECVPLSASYVQNAPPANTPSSGGYYTQGGPEPIWVPLNGNPPPPPPPPTGGTFTASFNAVRGNEWWVQAGAAASGDTISNVDVSIGGGPWQPLAKQSWGGWAASYHIVQGTVVQLRAASPSGATALGGCYQWIPPSNQDAAKVACGTPPPPPPPPPTNGNLTATFQPTGGNDWWVQVKVTSPKPLSGVDVSANGGAWVPLDHSSWGDWVKSLYLKGSVKFQARATDGSVAASQPFAWPPGA